MTWRFVGSHQGSLLDTHTIAMILIRMKLLATHNVFL